MTNAIFTNSDISTLNLNDFEDLVEKAKVSNNQRYRYCLHLDHSAKIQEMVIAMTSESYNQPHRHPEGISESYHIIKGRMLILFFDDSGAVSKKVILEPGTTQILRMNKSVWHMAISLSENSIYHETLTGPFDKDKVVEYASWAPKENHIDANDYLNNMRINER